MSKSSMRGVLLSTILMISLTFVLPNVYAELEIDAVSSGTTTILTVSTNDESVDMFRMWLSSGTTFESFKGERGWIGEITPQGVLIFRTNEPLVSDDSVKFGFKTNTVKPQINWRALDGTTEIKVGVVVPQDLQSVPMSDPITTDPDDPPDTSMPSDPITTDPDDPSNTGTPNIDPPQEPSVPDVPAPVIPVKGEPTFRIIPDRPSVGTSIRVVGENFDESESFDFYMDSTNLGSFRTTPDGTFVITIRIPDDQIPDRVDFKVIDSIGEETSISVRLGQPIQDIVIQEPKLELGDIPESVRRGSSLELSGTAKPNSAIVAEITNIDGRTVNARTTTVDDSGSWSFGNLIFIPYDLPLGTYDLLISDGRDRATQQLEVTTHKIIVLESTKRAFAPGDLIAVDVITSPESMVELVLEDSLGNERDASSLTIDQSGIAQFQYQSLTDDAVGTWKLTATQSSNREILYIGYGQPPIIPVTIEFDQLNYDDTEILEPVTVRIMGRASERVSMLIIGPTGSAEGDPINIQIGLDGTTTHTLDISDLDRGIYNAVITKGGIQSTAQFTVGLNVGSGHISASPTKLQYVPGESILILGNSKPDILLTASLINPNGTEIKKIHMPSDGEGNFNGKGLRIPSNAMVGQWKIKIASDSNFKSVDINVVSLAQESIRVSINESSASLSSGKLLNIDIEGMAPESVAKVVITNIDGTIVDDSLECTATTESRCTVHWIVDRDIEIGLYTITVTSGSNTASTTYEKLDSGFFS